MHRTIFEYGRHPKLQFRLVKKPKTTGFNPNIEQNMPIYEFRELISIANGIEVLDDSLRCFYKPGILLGTTFTVGFRNHIFSIPSEESVLAFQDWLLEKQKSKAQTHVLGFPSQQQTVSDAPDKENKDSSKSLGLSCG